MDENTGKSLDKILAKLEGLEAELGRVSNRLNALESDTPERGHQTERGPQTDKPDPADGAAPSDQPGESIDSILEQNSPSPSSSPIPTDASLVPPPIPPATQQASPVPAMPLPPGPVVPSATSAGEQPDVPPGPALPELAETSTQSHSRDAVAAYRARAQRDQTAKPRESLEMRIAGTWLPRIGVLVLALVLILFAREHVQGPLGKIIGSYLLSAGLIIVGLLYEKKYPRWAGPVLAGGLAFSYFASYAMGFVEPMRLLDSLPLKLTILAVNLVVIFGFAQRKRSEVMAGTALVLGYLTTGVVGNDAAAMGSCVALSIVAVAFLWWNQWLVSTSIAAGASYVAFVYIQKAVPDAVVRTPGEVFWSQFLPLSLLFVVFVVATWVAVGIVSKARAKQVDEPDEIKTSSLANMATALAQTNVAAYIAAMVWVLHSTQVYWPRAWVFFFPMVAVCGTLAMVFARVRPVQQVHYIAGAVCLALGLLSAASPKWLPLLLAGQAIAMLAASFKKPDTIWWNAVSLLVLIYACGYAMFNRAFSTLWHGPDNIVEYPWWILGGIGAMTLAYTILWEKWQSGNREKYAGLGMLAYFISGLAAVMWLLPLDTNSGWLIVYAGAAVPIGLFAAYVFRAMSPVTFVVLTAYSSVGALFAAQGSYFGPWTAGYWAVGAAGATGGYLIEKHGNFSRTFARILWSVTYTWVQFFLICGIMRGIENDWRFLVIALFFAGAIAAGWFFRSAAMAKSGAVPLLMLAVAALTGFQWEHWSTFIAIGVMLAAAYPIGLARWRERTGDTSPKAMFVVQSIAVAVAGWTWVFGLGEAPYHVNKVFLAGSWALVTALFVAAGGFATALWVAFAFSIISAAILWIQAVSGELPGGGDGFLQATHGAQVVWALWGIALIVATDRVLVWAVKLPRRAGSPWTNSAEETHWPDANGLRGMSALMAVGTMLMAVMALRIMPELRMFYFTGAMVVVAFVWIVFGFWFREPVYRKSGLVLLCGGLVKGLVYDVLSLKNTLYRQISWTVLGVLAIGASFLYNKFRGRVE